jgi:hypothetical protein
MNDRTLELRDISFSFDDEAELEGENRSPNPKNRFFPA